MEKDKMRVLFYYANDEEVIDIYKDLAKHMRPMPFNKFVKIVDKDIALAEGIDFTNSKKVVNDNDIIVSLLSADFLNDSNCMAILNESRMQSKKVLPMLITDCNFQVLPEFKPYLDNVIPKNRTILALKEEASDPHEVFTDVIAKISEFITGKVNIELSSPNQFLWISIVSLVVGLGVSYFTFQKTQDPSMMLLSFGLFLIIAIVSIFKYVSYIKLSKQLI